MRLIELSFAALGPFAGEQRIRFADFEASGLFLMRGATGSGKSSIIDAVLFALYGEAPLKDTSSALRLRSNYAAKDTVSYAQLLFEVPSGCYLVRRTPRYVKPGNKNATLATATLEKVRLVSGEIVERTPLGAKPAEVNPLIAEIVGIRHDQFLQTVVLPQGKFAEFVRATPDSRKALLQQIFKTQQFDQFTDLLRGRAKEAKAEFDALSLQARFQLSTITGVDSSEVPLEVIEETATDTLDDYVAYVGQLKDKAQILQACLTDSQMLCREVRAGLDMQEAYQRVVTEMESLTEQLPQFTLLRQQTQAAVAARPVVSAGIQLQEARAQAETVLETVKAETSLPFDDLSELSVSAVNRVLVVTEKLLTVSENHVQELEKQQLLLASLEKASQALATHDKQYADYCETAEDAEKILAAAQQPMENFISQIQSLTASLEGIPELQTQILALETRLIASRKADTKRKELVECAESIGLARRQQVAAQQNYQIAWESWTADTARLLAQELADGVACAVCGSLTHPRPASEVVETDFTIPTAAQVAAKLQELQDVKLSLEVQQQLQATLTEEITALNQQARGDSISLELELENLQGELSVLLDKKVQLAALEKTYEQAQTELQEITQKAQTNRLLAQENRKTRVELAEEVSRLTESTQALIDINQVSQQIADLRLKVTELKNGVNYLNQLHSYAQIIKASADSLEQTLLDSPFDSLAEATTVAAAVPDPEAALVKVSAYFTQMQRLEEQHLQLKEQLSQVGIIPDLSVLQKTRDSLQRKWQEAYAAEVSGSKQLQQLESSLQELARVLKLLAKLEETSGALRRLAELASGARTESGIGIPLSTWVLLERFEAVLAAANPYIAKFSGSRFKLVRVDEDGNSATHHGGLGISVYDSETDQHRPSKTLSGGETFYVSLALALGLAEVVSAEAGGIDFKSMLIDEGFGTLDPETLDKVLEGIKAINHSGRTVGIVSHVEELRRRISDGIEVISHAEGGSTLRIYS